MGKRLIIRSTGKRLIIRYPCGCHNVKKLFVAYGQAALDVTSVKGYLRTPPFGPVVAEGKTLREPPHWAIQFRVANGGSYVLEVWEFTEVPVCLLDASKVVVGARPPRGDAILYPTPGAPDCPVCPNFTASGTTQKIVPIKVTLTQPGFSMDGAIIQGAPTWSAQFTGAPIDTTNGYNLTLYDNSNPASPRQLAQQSPITVHGCIVPL
jgi:hypothetical protein